MDGTYLLYMKTSKYNMYNCLKNQAVFYVDKQNGLIL
jgi:hypothetical protein